MPFTFDKFSGFDGETKIFKGEFLKRTIKDACKHNTPIMKFAKINKRTLGIIYTQPWKAFKKTEKLEICDITSAGFTENKGVISKL